MKIKDFYKKFVGNRSNYIIWDKEEGHWSRRFTPITSHVLRKHFNHELVIGSYPIYKKSDVNYSRWICLDIDSHKKIDQETVDEIYEKYETKLANKIIKDLEKRMEKQTDKKIKAKQYEFVRIIYYNSIEWLGINKDSILVEDSGGGFHVWIILEKDTLLKDVGKWISMILKPLYGLYDIIVGEEDIEFYPKQYTTNHLQEGLGNGVRLPCGYNFKRDHECKNIFNGNISNLKREKLNHLVQNINFKDAMEILDDFTRTYEKTKRKLIKHKPKDLPKSLHFWMEFPIRPCFKRIITGETQAHNEPNAHQIRMAMVQELDYYGMPIDMMIECFKNQNDFKYNKTAQQIKSLLNSSHLTDGRYNCRTIHNLGYCHYCDVEKWK